MFTRLTETKTKEQKCEEKHRNNAKKGDYHDQLLLTTR